VVPQRLRADAVAVVGGGHARQQKRRLLREGELIRADGKQLCGRFPTGSGGAQAGTSRRKLGDLAGLYSLSENGTGRYHKKLPNSPGLNTEAGTESNHKAGVVAQN
jgi:hypothetical protein